MDRMILSQALFTVLLRGKALELLMPDIFGAETQTVDSDLPLGILDTARHTSMG